MSFNGTRVTYVYPTYYNRGHARIRIDGEEVAIVNLYSAGLFWQRHWVSAPYSAGLHTITIEAIDGVVDFDAFIVE